MRSIIKELNRIKGATVLLSSHDVGDIESLAQRIVLIDKGKILYDGATEKFNGIFGRYRTLRLDVHGHSESDIVRLKSEIISRVREEKEIVIGEVVSGWLAVSFDQDQHPLLELLNPILASFSVKDIKVADIEMEEVIKRVYEGALR